MRHPRTLLLLLSCLAAASPAADWPGWRGPDSLGISSEKGLPTHWSKESGLAWTVDLPGKGASSPIVVGDRVYVTSQPADTGLHVLAIDRKAGKVIWDREIGRGKLHANDLHNMATPTPVSDGSSIWVMFGTGDLARLDLDGQVIWERNLVKEYGIYKTNHGYGSSPMLYNGKLYVACMHQGPSYLVAIDAATGKNLWKKDRSFEPKDEAQDSYSSPFLLRSEGAPQVVLAGAESVNAYEPATGEQLWICSGFKVRHPYGRTIAGLTAGEGVLVTVSSGFQNQGYTVGLKPGGKGDITTTHKLWTQSKFSPDCPTPLIHEGKVYLMRDDGMASCLDVKTGEPYWQERLFTANVKVSPVVGDGKVYLLNGQGNCTVVKTGAKLEVLARNELNESTLSTPAISAGHLFLRAQGRLFCVGP